MRFMILVKADKDSEAGVFPPKSKALMDAMGAFNEEMIDAGILLAGDGLQPSSKGARIRFSGSGAPTVTDGPFAETKDLVAGYWVIDVKSRDEAIGWASRAPFDGGAELEVRPLFETSDFPAEVLSPDLAAKEQAWRDKLTKKAGNR